ncbi:polyphosphate polymerase domain-containing protein [uncultured Arcticibacterium sp.]|uniref:polyphosphate polymerase domain-containing protein n=1 Tax=uncultured Arcticibacterium sp. TaxID=2173042 RepID=UPI0030F73733
MNRSDTKFILPKNQVLGILSSLSDKYRVLEVNQNRLMTYNSLYYDTPEHAFYQWHHNGKVNRIKVRIRNYVESNLHFLEVKRKNGKGMTKKSRIGIKGFEEKLTERSKNFIEETTNQTFQLSPILENKFNRITLVSKTHKERATIDFNLNFLNEYKEKTYDRLAIIEIKQEGVNRNSPIYQALKIRHILPSRISKYCLGMISLYNDIKYNTFKEKLLQIQKLTA